MRYLSISLLLVLSGCAAESVSMPPEALSPTGLVKDTISCDHPLVVNAYNERDGIVAERTWLDTHFPGHSPYSQSLRYAHGHTVDVLSFTASDGRAISVCFDINSFFGRLD